MIFDIVTRFLDKQKSSTFGKNSLKNLKEFFVTFRRNLLRQSMSFIEKHFQQNDGLSSLQNRCQSQVTTAMTLKEIFLSSIS